MTFPIRPRDTIAWRFGATIVASMAVACALTGLFLVFGGVWARPPIDVAARLEGGMAIIHMLEASPPAMRPKLAEAARTQIYRVDWYAEKSATSIWLDAAADGRRLDLESRDLREFSDTVRRTVMAFTPAEVRTLFPDFPLRSSRYPEAHYFTVNLDDGSWVVFTGFNRDWGLSQSQRVGVWAAFLLVSFAVVSTIATRQISRPIRRFAGAVRRSGGGQSPPIAREGPQELREVIAAFNDMQAQIQEFVAYRTSMLTAISHDLRTPLTRLRLRGEFIVDKAQQAKLFRDVDEMRAMIDGALAFFRGDADEEARRAFDLADVLQSIADDYADQGVEIRYAGPDHLTYVGCPVALKRVFANLIENAVKYGTPPEVALVRAASATVVSVRDRGAGIPEDALARVFKPFYRVDESRNRATGGVGLGLTSAQSVVRRHGGDIALRNHPEGGLEVTVTLPEADPSADAASARGFGPQ